MLSDQDVLLSSMSDNIIPEIQLPPGLEHQDSEDWDNGGKGGSKVKLVRSHAIRDSTSPPPPGHSGHTGHTGHNMNEAEACSERSTGTKYKN